MIPLGELAQRTGELDSSREVVTHCKGGVRSLKAAEILKQAGFQKSAAWPAESRVVRQGRSKVPKY